MSIKKQIILLILLMTVAPLGIITFSAYKQRKHGIEHAFSIAATVVRKAQAEQNILASAAHQLAVTLSHVPAVRNQDARAASRLLSEILASSPQYASIFLLDEKGTCWAAAIPEQVSRSYADRRYVANALATGRFSSGEFTIGKVLRAPVFSFAYPMKDDAGTVIGVIAIVVNLERYGVLFETGKLPGDASILLVDSKGIILYSTLYPERVGTPDKPDLFRRMFHGPEEGTFTAEGNLGSVKFFAYRKLHLQGEETPYMYIRSGVTKEMVVGAIDRDLTIYASIVSSLMVVMIGLSILIAKRGILDKITILQRATQEFARGNLETRVADRVSGGELGVLGQAFDEMAETLAASIAERRRAEQDLQQKEESFRLAFEEASDAIFWGDADTGTIINCNKAAEKMVEASRDEIIGNHQTTLHPPEMLDEYAAKFRKGVAEHHTFTHVEAIVLSRSGRRIPVEIRHSITVIGGRRILQGLFRDISERKQAEELLKERSELIDLARDAIILRDVDGKIFFWNRGAEKMFGYGAADAVGRLTHDLLQTVFPQSLVDINAHLLAEGYWEGHLRHTSQEGKELTVASRWVVQRREDGTARVMELCTDITEHESLQRELLKVQKLESLGVLAGGIAHDFNNILTAIMGNISFALLYLDPSHKAFPILRDAENATQRASDLSYQLLTFAKGSKPIKKTVAVKQIVEASASLILRGSSVQGIIQVPETLYIEADEGQISQTCNNIIINAVQAMPAGGSLTITAAGTVIDRTTSPSGLPLGDYVRISFSDTGCGIAEDDQKRVFDPYFTTKPGGTGLGLASAHSIVSKHGGHLGVRSTVGSGTTVEILLPASSAPVAVEATSPAPAATDRTGVRVLVMDDEEMIRELAASLLAALGYDVETCSDGREAVALYEGSLTAGLPFSAVIMDLTVPGGMGGKDAATEILSLDPNACLVVSSGYSNDPVLADHAGYGFRAAMVKPYNVRELSNLLDRVLAPQQGPSASPPSQ